ncbi:MAG: LysR family transcriptional regulator [Trueperaceae bacterium]|nr:LysR family transcriptional regulator [Trueperaceae bacterium]
MALEPQLLRTFLVVARGGSISEAARRLHRSQPAVTSAVRRLEAHFGEPLFRRGGKGVRLTDLGARLLPHAEALERVLDGVNQLAAEAAGLEGARLRIAASTTIALYWLPPRLARFCSEHPSAKLVVHTRNSREAVEELAAGEVDLALVEAPAASWSALPDGLLVATPVHDDELVLVVDPDHPLAAADKVAPQELGGLAFVGREAGSGTRAVLEQALATLGPPRDATARAVPEPPQGKASRVAGGQGRGATPDVRLELGEPEAIKRAVRAGLGAAVLSRVAVAQEVERGELVALSITHPGFRRQFTLLHPPEALASHACWTFRTLAVAG